jgi:hypothetical protein
VYDVKFAPFLTLKLYILLSLYEILDQCVILAHGANQSTNLVIHLGFSVTFFAMNAPTVNRFGAMH